MLFGHNSNVVVGKETVHVQTEDRGIHHAFIDTTVHWRGRVLHRRTSQYQDLLPLDTNREAVLKTRVDDQHRAVVDEIRSGTLQLPFPATQPAAAAPVAVTSESEAISATPVSAQAVPAALKVELTNAKSWLAGKHATLQLLVKDSSGNPVPAAMASARVEGAELPAVYTHETAMDGSATLEFEMPKLSGSEFALVIEASSNGAKGHLRFQLKAKPRV